VRSLASAPGFEQELDIIHGVSAYLNPWQIEHLRTRTGVRLFQDRAVSTRACLLGSLVSTTNTLVSSVNNTVASSPVGTVVTARDRTARLDRDAGPQSGHRSGRQRPERGLPVPRMVPAFSP